MFSTGTYIKGGIYMYVERLSIHQVSQFLKENLTEDMYYPGYGVQIELKEQEKHYWNITYLSKPNYVQKNIRLMDDSVYPKISQNFEQAWIDYILE